MADVRLEQTTVRISETKCLQHIEFSLLSIKLSSFLFFFERLTATNDLYLRYHTISVSNTFITYLATFY